MFNQLGMEIFKVMKGKSLGIKKKILLARDEGSCQLKQRSHFHLFDKYCFQRYRKN